MSFTDLDVVATYAGNGSTTGFSPNQNLSGNDQLKVYLKNNASLAYTLQVLNVDYTLTGSPATSVVFTVAPASGFTVVIVRSTALTQPTDYLNTGNFLAETHEAALDRVVMQLQELDSRAIKNPVYDTTTTLLPERGISQILGTDSNGNWQWYAPGVSGVITGILPIANGGTNSTVTPTAGGIGYGTGTAHAYSAAGTSGQFLSSTGAGAPTWGWPQVPTSVKTTTYSIAATDQVVLVNGASAFTVTLPTAVGISGKAFQIKRVDQTLANAVTIATTSSQTIDGATTRKLMTQYEQFTVVSDGANWQVLSHTYPQGWTSFTPTGSWSTNTTYTGLWKRVGTDMEVQFKVATSGAPTSAALTVNLVSGLTANSSASVDTNENNVGWIRGRDEGTGSWSGWVKWNTTTSVALNYILVSSGSDNIALGGVSQAAPMTFANTDYVVGYFKLPITDWEA